MLLLTVGIKILCGSVAEWLGSWICDQQVAGSNSGCQVQP